MTGAASVTLLRKRRRRKSWEVTNTDCEWPEVNIVQRLDDYLYVEYKDLRFGLVDDVEFFAPGDRSRVEY